MNGRQPEKSFKGSRVALDDLFQVLNTFRVTARLASEYAEQEVRARVSRAQF